VSGIYKISSFAEIRPLQKEELDDSFLSRSVERRKVLESTQLEKLKVLLSKVDNSQGRTVNLD